ncbi:MAG: DUF2493 domain-containing protein [Bacteroidales bacterium]|nr:DUF2493 domain-containing protein [Bacteroidales bacterium]
MHVIIAGCRTFNDYDFVETEVLKIIGRFIGDEERKIQIISGEAKGVDQLAKKFAEKHGLEFIPIPADWKSKGRAAGPKRNEEMAKLAGTLIAFWDGKSKGTKSMIDYANKYCHAHYVIRIDQIGK